MPTTEAPAPSTPARPEAGRPARSVADLSPVLAAIAVGGFALSDEQFAEALDELRRELAPTGVLESIFVALLVEAAERLRVASRKREEIAAGDAKWTRFR